MASLIAKSPAEGLLPATAGACTLREVVPEAIISVAPFLGREAEVSAALKAALGAGFPAPGQVTGAGPARVIWTGRGQAMVLGPAPAAIPGAAVTDQSDGWAVLRLEGADAEAVLARLVPADLRAPVFGAGRTARTLLGHMPVSVTRIAAQTFDLMVFRSMARTAVHELVQAMRSVAAQR